LGAWNYGNFGSDDAGLVLSDIIERGDSAMIDEVLADGVRYDGHLEAPESGQAVAACAVLAILRGLGESLENFSGEFGEWVGKQQSRANETSILGVATIDRVLEYQCELKVLWEEGNLSGAWKNELEIMRAGLAEAAWLSPGDQALELVRQHKVGGAHANSPVLQSFIERLPFEGTEESHICPSRWPPEIHGRERLLIEANGGASSASGKSNNAINGISGKNKNREASLRAAIEKLGAIEQNNGGQAVAMVLARQASGPLRQLGEPWWSEWTCKQSHPHSPNASAPFMPEKTRPATSPRMGERRRRRAKRVERPRWPARMM